MKNWREIGGGDQPIVVVLGRKVGGLMSEFQKLALDGADFAPNAIYVDTAAEMKARVKDTPGAVSIGTLAQVQDPTINHISYPAPARQIYMIWKGASRKRHEIDELYQYLWSPEAKRYTLSEYRRPRRK